MKILFFVYAGVLSWIWICSCTFSLTQISEEKVFDKIVSLSYLGMHAEIDKLGYLYSVGQYIKQSLLIGIGTGILVYLSIHQIFYTLLIVLILIFLIPYFNYLRLKVNRDQKIEESIFVYVQTALIYLREEKTVMQILKDCSLSIEGVLYNDINEAIDTILISGELSKGLDFIEGKHPYSVVKNLNVLLKGKNNEGSCNKQIVDYLFENTESYERVLNSYKLKKKANQFVFYTITVLNCIAIIMLTNLFMGKDAIIHNTALHQVLFIYYILNICTIFYYETWCSKQKSLE